VPKSVTHLPVNVDELDIDFLAFSGHKLFGPSGIGVLWGKQSVLLTMDPFQFGGNMIRESFPGNIPPGRPPAKVRSRDDSDCGSHWQWSAAVKYVASLDRQAVHAHEAALARESLQTLIRSRESQFTVQVWSIAAPSSALPSREFTLTTWPTCSTIAVWRSGRAIIATMPLHEHLDQTATARASFAFYNTLEEVDALAGRDFVCEKVFRGKFGEASNKR